MAEHTPGPWDNDGNEIFAKDSMIATVTLPLITDADRMLGPEIVANARLIAAAPELLAALKELRKFVADNVSFCPQATKVDQAIAKAEGRRK